MATTTPVTKSTRTINLSKRLKRTHNPRRIGNSIRLVREEIARHSKTSPENVRIGGELNRYLLLGAMQGFYGVKVAIEKKGEIVSVDLFEKRKRPQLPAADGAKSKSEAKGSKAAALPGEAKKEAGKSAEPHPKAEPHQKGSEGKAESKAHHPTAPHSSDAPGYTGVEKGKV